MPIPRGLIRRMAKNNDIYTDGLKCFEAGSVGKVHVEDTHYMDEYVLHATVKTEQADYHVSVEIDDYNEQITNPECSCKHNDCGGVCPHVVALLLDRENEFFNKNILKRRGASAPRKAETDEVVLSLIKNYSEKTVSRTIAANSGNTARLLPLVLIDDENIKIGLKIDLGRTYVVKSISSFYENMRSGAYEVYGVDNMFLHDINNFDEESRPLLNFVMTYYSDSSDSLNAEKKYMSLKDHALDKFMQMYCGKVLKAKESGNMFDLKITDKLPEFRINIKKTKEDFFGVCLNDTDYQLIRGRERIYIKKGSRLCVCSREYSEKCGEFLSVMKNKEMYIVKSNDMTSLYSTVFKTVSDFIPINSKEDLSAYRPRPLSAEIYLDSEVHKLSAKLIFKYGKDKYAAFDVNRDKSTVGDIEGEMCVQTVLLSYLPDKDEKNCSLYTDDDDKIYDFLTVGMSELSMYATFFISDDLKRVKVKHPKSIGVGVRLKSDLLDLNFDAGEFDAAELGDIIESYKNNKKYYRLKDGSFLSLENDVLRGILSITEGLAIKPQELFEKKATVPKYRAMYLDAVMKDSFFSFYDRDDEFKKLVRDMKSTADSDITEPSELKNVLRNYQKAGFKWLKTLEMSGFSGILADDMGLGKTLQVLAVIKAHKQKCGTVSALVVCPASLCLNWESEIMKFTPQLNTLCVIGTTDERVRILENAKGADVVITSYELLKRDIDEYTKMNFDYEIIDEAQYIKNYATQNAKAVKLINSKTKFALTGTPIENNLSELWSIFDFLMPGYLYNHSYFKQNFETPIIRDKNEEALKRLKELTAPFVLRRLKSDVLSELPEKTETVLYAQPDEKQKKLYAATAHKFKKEFEDSIALDGISKSRFMVLAMLMRLRQICCDPSLVYENYEGESAKLALCMSLVKSLSESGHKMLLFSQFTSMLDILAEKLSAERIDYYEIRGSTSKAERLDLVNRFNSDKTPVFLISLKAGGTGLNLTGADMVIHYDPWWNRSVQNQATDRAYRIGQKNSVQVYKLIVKDSIEEKILNLQERKSDLADSVITGGEFNISSLSREELLKLFD